jgi:hypothetical protein
MHYEEKIHVVGKEVVGKAVVGNAANIKFKL